MFMSIFLPGLFLSALMVVIILFVVWLWAIIDCLRSRLDTTEKLLWLVIIFFFHFLGAVVYFIFVNKSKKMKHKKFKGKRLFRSRKNRMIAGVCGGIGEYLDVDPTIVRILWVLLVVFGVGAGIIAYILAWIIIPEE